MITRFSVDLLLHRPRRLQRHHRRFSNTEQLYALLLPLRAQPGQLHWIGAVCGFEEVEGGAGAIFGGGNEGKGEEVGRGGEYRELTVGLH